LLNTKDDILINIWAPLTFFPLHILHNIVWVQQKKEIHSGLEQLDVEHMMTEFKFLGELSL